MSIKSDIQGFDISGKSAVIIGCGGLGTNVSVNLAGAGIGRLLLIDFDTVEERNLNRQYYYTPGDKGEDKARILCRRLKAFAPEVEIDYIAGRFDGGIPGDYDVVIAAVDNIDTRVQVNEYCKANGKPCINGSINGFFGTAYMYIPGKTPDLEAAGCLNKTGVRNQSPSTTAAIIGALEAQLAIDSFLGRGGSAGRLYIYDNNEIHTLDIRSEEID